jgi:hypothetical protein
VRGGRPADEAVQTIVELEGLRARVQGDLQPLRSLSFPLLLWGGLTLASAIPAWFGGGWLGLYWLLAAPAGIFVVARHFGRLERRIGVVPPGSEAVLWLALALAVAMFAAGALLGGIAAGYVLAIGYAAFAWALRSRACLLLGAGMALLTAAVQVSDPGRPDALLALLLGTAALGTGVALRR